MRTLAALLMLMLLAIPAHAYDMSDLRRDMRAHIDKMMKDVGDVTLEQEATFESGSKGLTGMTATTYVKGLRWRSETLMKSGGETPDVEMTSMYDGTDMWTVMMGMKHKLPKGSIGQSGASGMWDEFPDNARVVGEDQLSGRAAWKVEYEPEKGAPNKAPVTVWVDKSSFVPIQMETKLSGEATRMVMSDFRKVKGSYEYPFLTEMFTGGKKAMTLKVLKIETSKGLSDDLFDPEKLTAGEGMDMGDMMKKAMEMQKQMEEMNKKGGK